MVKKSTSDTDFINQLRQRPSHGSSGGSDSAIETPTPTKSVMKLNTPPTGPRISTDELYENEEKKEQSIKQIHVDARTNVGGAPSYDSIRKLPIHLIDDSPYQPRLTYDPTELDALGASLRTSGQVEAITVRMKADRYELLGGHRRIRAARNIGWPDIEARIVACDDTEAEKITLLQNESRIDLSEYERGKLYERAQERGFAKTQEEIAAMFGCNQSTVSNCLKLLALPDEIKARLEDKPSLFGSTTAKVLLKLLEEHPTEMPLMLEFVDRLEEKSVNATSLKSWFVEKIAKRSRKKKERTTITGKSGRTLFSTSVAKGKVQIQLGNGLAVDEEVVQRWILAALRERADQAETQ